PPAASASYVLPDYLFERSQRLREIVATITLALEFNGYVERSFLRTEAGGVALVTRLERINDDGSSAVGHNRWSVGQRHPASTYELASFLRGLFYADPGRYRVIVFILQDLPFSQSSQSITEKDARAWLRGGANILPPGARGTAICGRPLHSAGL